MASNLKTFRAVRGWSQTKLAEKTGSSTQYIAMIETKVKYPSSAMIERLAKALRIDPAELFYREIDPETIRKNMEKAIIEDMAESFSNMVNDFFTEKIKKLDDEPIAEEK